MLSTDLDRQSAIAPSQTQTISAQGDPNKLVSRFLVCGLGSLGQFCVSALAEFGVEVNAITLTKPTSWDIPEVPDVVDELFFGDCRDLALLKKARVQDCRAVLLVASDERINIETAFAVRRLNPDARLVVRSSKEKLNGLLTQKLGNFVAFEPTQLSASAFAIAALDNEIRGFIDLDGYRLRVVKMTIDPDHRWCDRRSLVFRYVFYDDLDRGFLCHPQNSLQQFGSGSHFWSCAHLGIGVSHHGDWSV
jgi:voltage-gated potassium channel Kch